MEDPRGKVLAAAGPQPLPGGGLQHPAATRRVSPDAFLRGASIAWAHLQPEERKAVRATCRNGRQLYDRLTTHLHIKLGRVKVQKREPVRGQQDEQRHRAPLFSGPGLRTSLGAMVARGARLQSLTVCFKDAEADIRQAQLLAALEACSGCPLTHLKLSGAVPLSGPTAEAAAACCPHMSDLHLNVHLCLPPEGPRRAKAAAEYHYGYSLLLTLCGPRLRELHMSGLEAERWPALSYMALRQCTALTKLVMEAPNLTSSPDDDCGPTFEAGVYSTVAQLTALQSLHLSTSSHPSSLDAVRRHATHVASLSSLTALTHLQLDPPSTYEDHGDDHNYAENTLRELEDWCAAREAYRASLLSALRCMPQLQSFSCSALWLRPSELAPLTALTNLQLVGLLPPDGSGPGVPPAVVALPPQLHTLGLRVGASPRAFALLQPSAAFTRLDARYMQFGMSDMREDGQLLEETVEAVGPAVRLLMAYRHRDRFRSQDRFEYYERLFVAGRGPENVRPREGSPNGHIEWIRQLGGLDGAYDCVTIDSMVLSPADMSCVGHTLRNLQGLELACEFPVTCLPLLRNPMLRLTRLMVNLGECGCDHMDSATLEPLLLLLCMPHSGAVPLRRLKVLYWPLDEESEQSVQSVQGQLEAAFGVTGVTIDLMYDDMSE